MSNRKDPELEQPPTLSDAGERDSDRGSPADQTNNPSHPQDVPARELNTAEQDLKAPVKALAACLDDLFTGRTIEKGSPLPGLLYNVDALMRSVREIQNQPGWDTSVCVRFVSALLHSIVNKSATTLQSFVKKGHCTLDFKHTAAEIASALLSAQMEILEQGDHYFVVSDLASWRDAQLEEFRRCTGVALEKGVDVKRVFNLVRNEPTLNPLSLEDRRSILNQHLEDSEAWNQNGLRYQVCLFTPKDFEILKEKKPGIKFLEQEISQAHFGIFSHGTEGRMLLEYEPKEFDLSKMNLQKDEESIKPHWDIFLEIWKNASPLTKEEVNDYLLTCQSGNGK